jgi:cytoskeletal protein CcmA (bactofilin family)
VGNITADDKVEIAPSGSVQGDVRAPRVAIADGAKFKGTIDMDRKAPASATVSASSSVSRAVVPPVPSLPTAEAALARGTGASKG